MSGLVALVYTDTGSSAMFEGVRDIEVPGHANPPLIVSAEGLTAAYAPGEWSRVMTVPADSEDARRMRVVADEVLPLKPEEPAE